MATTRKASDSRLVRSSDKRDAVDPSRAPRSVEDHARTQQDGLSMYTEDELESMIRSEFTQEALPSPPAIPGWHLCWLSTTSNTDSIAKRMRIGYRPVAPDEVKGFSADRMNGGQFDGAVSCNEMVLFKVPEKVYQAIMREYHHNQPHREEEAIKERLASIQQQAVSSKGNAFETSVEGFEDLAVKRAVPDFMA